MVGGVIPVAEIRAGIEKAIDARMPCFSTPAPRHGSGYATWQSMRRLSFLKPWSRLAAGSPGLPRACGPRNDGILSRESPKTP